MKRYPGYERPIGGICCQCGYGSPGETPCSKREDGTHCNHWWDGDDTPPIAPGEYKIVIDEVSEDPQGEIKGRVIYRPLWPTERGGA